MRDRCHFLPHHQPASFEHSSIVNLGGILRTTYDVVWPLRLWITFMIVSTITLLIDPVRMSKADAVLIVMYGSLSALVDAYFGFSRVVAIK